MSAPNPQVSVFHFTSRISSAKIRKYKLATERGMAAGNSNIARANSVPSPIARPPVAMSNPSIEPPPRKRLKLSVGPPPESPISDTIAVARPKRESSLRIRYDSNMTFAPGEGQPSPGASSDLTSLAETPPLAAVEPVTVVAPVANETDDQEYGRNFTSYYVMDDDDDKPKPQPKPKTMKPPSVPPPRTQQPVQQQHRATLPPQSNLQTEFRHHVPPPPPSRPSYSAPAARPPPAPAPVVPRIELVDFEPTQTVPTGPQTVLEMKKKLEVLSDALTKFGGVPPVPKSPELKTAEAEKKNEEHGENPLDGFLGMFEGDDDDEDDDSDASEKKTKKAKHPLDYILESPGASDGPLTYGIQFIQNALRSWAQQRLQHQYAQWIAAQPHQQPPPPPQKRGPGRPRKFPDSDMDVPAPPTQHARVKYHRLDTTPEGFAIKAFQEVLDSGCLTMNARLPIEFTRALRHLYMQIDHLINQGAKQEKPWVCMSYQAQIAGNAVRVAKWKEAQTKVEEEMARQQHLAQQQVMQQMGLVPPPPEQLTTAQAQHAHAVDLERRRSMQHAAQQPYISQQHLHPLLLGSQSAGTPTGFAPSPSPGNATDSRARQPPTLKSMNVMPNGLPQQSHTNGSKKRRQSAQNGPTGQMQGFLPRSGQSMTFSFAPSNADALRAFGADAFPNASMPDSNLPNRGPMMSGALPSQHSPANAAATVTPVKSIEVDSAQVHGHAHGTSGSANNGLDSKVIKKEATSTPAAPNAVGFTAINTAPRVNARQDSTPAGLPTAASPISLPAHSSVSASASPAMGSVSNTNHPSGLASSFPHAGAVVVDH